MLVCSVGLFGFACVLLFLFVINDVLLIFDYRFGLGICCDFVVFVA